MPHIEFDLDAKKRVPPAARLAGISEAAMGWGLPCLWELCWTLKTDEVNTDQLIGLFGGDGQQVGRALVAFGFAEDLGGGMWRVRGAARYLRITAARSAGAKKTNAKRWGERHVSDPPATAPPSLAVALSPNTEHRKEEEGPPPPRRIEPELSGPGFFARVQAQRVEHGLVAERLPHLAKLGAWYSEAMLELNGDDGRLWAGYARFTDSAHWKQAEPPWPFPAFMKLWRDHVPSKRATT